MKYPRVRMFAGPNGSGKSIMKSVLYPDLLGFYINPDELEKEAHTSGFIGVASFGIEAASEEIAGFFRSHPLLLKSGLVPQAEKLTFRDGKIHFNAVGANSYFAAVAADFLRQKLLEKRASFSFETVMSSPGKVEFLEKARGLGYHAYLYYVATEDPEINISRVQVRVKQGGHDVPEDKIRTRYYRSLGLLHNAIRQSNRAYLFDNSGNELIWLAEFTDGEVLEAKTDNMPGWFERAVLDKIEGVA